MKRFEQFILIASTLAFSWLGMQVVHEFGHVLAARATGGTLIRVVLYPTAISRTEVFPNPHPLIEVWAGPALGSVLPCVAYFIAAAMRSPGLYLFRFFAGFCLVANGSYLVAGSLEQMGDPHELILHGNPPWLIICIGLGAAGAGLAALNGLGKRFGRGASEGDVSRAAACASFALAVALIVVELLAAAHE